MSGGSVTSGGGRKWRQAVNNNNNNLQNDDDDDDDDDEVVVSGVSDPKMQSWGQPMVRRTSITSSGIPVSRNTSISGGTATPTPNLEQYNTDMDQDLVPTTTLQRMDSVDVLGTSFHSMVYADDSNDFQANLERFSKESSSNQNKKNNSKQSGTTKATTIFLSLLPNYNNWKIYSCFALLLLSAAMGTGYGVIQYKRHSINSSAIMRSSTTKIKCDTETLSDNPFQQCICGQEIANSPSDEMESLFTELQQHFGLSEQVIPHRYSCDNPHAVSLWWMALHDTSSSISGSGTRNEKTLLNQYVLALIYTTLSGPTWSHSAEWMSLVVNECLWDGIICASDLDFDQGNVVDFHVKKLNLGQMNLVGTLPSEIGLLTDLQSLSLRNNQISGVLPSTLATMTQLRRLDVQQNVIQGKLLDLSRLSHLQYLVLGENAFTGTIPGESLLTLTGLQELNLAHNAFTGTLPSSLVTLTQLSFLQLGNNQFQGPLPNLLALTDLQELVLTTNQISGTLSEDSLPVSLELLDLSVNFLSSTIPTTYGSLEKLTVLNLGCNHLGGSLPSEIGNLFKLSQLIFDGCDLTGTIPSDLGILEQVVTLNLSGNKLNGSIPQEICNLKQYGFLQEFVVNCDVNCPCCINECIN